MSIPSGPLPEVISSLRDLVESHLSALVDEAEPEELYDPVRYVLAGGGKRLRPVLVLLTARGFGVDTHLAMPAALAVEVFHNFTLVHDDIMDHSDERRGRPTVHTRWNQDVAILAGDYLMSLAYQLLARGPAGSLREILEVFGEMVGQLCEGQTLDKVFETRRDVTVAEYLAMIDAKTGALLRTCLEVGGVLGDASGDERRLLREAGLAVGRAFQMQDDLLDIVADDERWGKKVGGDLTEGKRTFLLLRCLETLEGQERSWFQQIIDAGGLDADLVPEARSRMQSAGVVDETRAKIREYTLQASERLAMLSESRDLQVVTALFDSMMVRDH